MRPMKIQNALEMLRNLDLKVTKSRVQLIEILFKSKKPLTSREILEELPAKSCDEATVFRMLKTFKEKELISVNLLKGNTPAYQLNLEHRHFVSCTQCGKIQNLPTCSLSPMLKTARDLGFQALSHRVEILGLCSNCA